MMSEPPRNSILRTIRDILLAIAVLTTLLILESFLNHLHPFFDSLTDIRVPLAILTIILSVFLLFTTMRRQGFILIIFAVAVIAASYNYGSLSQTSLKNSQPVIKLLQTNLRFDNKTPEKLLELIDHENPDIITLQEGSKKWGEFFQANGLTMMGCSSKNDRIGTTGVILSKEFLQRFGALKPTALDCYEALSTRGYVAELSLTREDQNTLLFRIISTHLSWPWPFGQNLQLDELENNSSITGFSTVNTPTIVAGDFNSVTWSNTVSRMEKLTATRHVSGIGPTWLSYKFPDFLRPYLGLPIDQVLLSKQFYPVSVKRMPSIGSDHLPIMVEFQFDPDQK